MAFLKVEKKKSGTYLQVVETYRNESGSPRHRTLYNLGKAEHYRPETLRSMGKKLFELGGGGLKDLLGLDTVEEGRYNYGYHQVYSRLFKHYNLDKVLKWVSKRHELSYDIISVVLLLLVERLQSPCSKLATYRHQEEYLGLPAIELHWLYRTLDYLDKHSERFKKVIYRTGRDLFNNTLDVVFYDVTTFYFDSEVVAEDAIRQKGFGKDGKIGKTQVLFSMLIDKDKRPVSYEIYEGNTYEGHTFEDAVKALKETYNIRRVIVVADRGMLSKHNIEIIEQTETYEFIVGERLKNLPKADQADLLNLADYQQEWVYDKETEKEPLKIRYRVLSKDNKTIIGTWSAKRARKDAHQREEKIAKAEKLLKNPSKIERKASRYFLKKQAEGKNTPYEIDWDKIEQQKKYDGFLAIATNVKELETIQILDQYRHLFQIEHAFRTFKSYLEARPMFHWRDSRIRGHLCLCYMAYTLLNHLQLELKTNGLPHTEQTIRKALSRMQVSLIAQGNNRFYLRSKMDEQQQNILKVLKIKRIPNIIPKTAMTKYVKPL